MEKKVKRLSPRQEGILSHLYADQKRWLDSYGFGRKSINALIRRGLVKTSYRDNICFLRLTERGQAFMDEQCREKRVKIALVEQAFMKIARDHEGEDVRHQWEALYSILLQGGK